MLHRRQDAVRLAVDIKRPKAELVRVPEPSFCGKILRNVFRIQVQSSKKLDVCKTHYSKTRSESEAERQQKERSWRRNGVRLALLEVEDVIEDAVGNFEFRKLG